MSNEAKFTKGKWVVVNKVPTRFDQNPINNSVKMPSSQKTKYGACVYAVIGGFDIKKQRCEAESNAHLIASAPEMYEMLESLREDHGLLTAVGKDIDKLLAKARGEK